MSLKLSFSDSKRFLVPPDASVERTYSHLYFSRQASLKKNCLATSRLSITDPKVIYCFKILDVKADQESLLFGTLFKKMTLKPSVLDHISLLGIEHPSSKESYINPDDELYLDDGHSRVTLVFPPFPSSSSSSLSAEEEQSELDPSLSSTIKKQNNPVLTKSESKSNAGSTDQNGPSYLSVDSLPTGVVCSVYGVLDGVENVFRVSKIFFPQPKPKTIIPRPITSNTPHQDDAYICFASNLSIGSDKNIEIPQLSYPILLQFIKGEFLSHISSKLKLFCLLGGLTNYRTIQDSLFNDTLKPQKPQRGKRDLQGLNKKNSATAPLTLTDYFLSEAADNVPFLLLPGESDPVAQSFPQQPMQTSIIFPVSNRKVGHFRETSSRAKAALFPATQILENNIKSLTNPGIFSTPEYGTTFLATSGQNINSIRSYTNITSSIDAIEASLRWAHMAPTCPDSLTTYPFQDSDPFIIDTLPDVYIVGNQPKYESSTVSIPTRASTEDSPVYQPVQVVSVPGFDTTGIIVLYNLHTRVWSTITISI